METNIFIENKLGGLMNKLSKENKKKIYISGDFNFDLLKFCKHSNRTFCLGVGSASLADLQEELVPADNQTNWVTHPVTSDSLNLSLSHRIISSNFLNYSYPQPAVIL